MYTARVVTFIIADDHAICRQGLKTFLENRQGIKYQIVAEAADDVELVKQVELYQPDIVIIDKEMSEMDCVKFCRFIKEKYPLTLIIILTRSEDESSILEMIRAGVNGYLLKKTASTELLIAIHTVRKGVSYFSDIIEAKIACAVNKTIKTNQIKFSIQEMKIINLIYKQSTNKEISAATCLHVRTVEDYRKKIQEKMKVKNAVGIVLYAMSHGIVNLGEP